MSKQLLDFYRMTKALDSKSEEKSRPTNGNERMKDNAIKEPQVVCCLCGRRTISAGYDVTGPGNTDVPVGTIYHYCKWCEMEDGR